MLALLSYLLYFGSMKCKHYIDVNDNTPASYTFDLEETEIICVNSTVPYLTIVFDTESLIRTKIFENKKGILFYKETQYFPVVYSGIDFSKSICSFEIEPLITSVVSFTLFAYPTECLYRYVTNLDNDFFSLGSKFGKVLPNSKICIWYGSFKYKFRLDFDPEINISENIQVCSSRHSCEPYNNKQKLNSKRVFFEISTNNEDIMNNVEFFFKYNGGYWRRQSIASTLNYHHLSYLEIELSDDSRILDSSVINERNDSRNFALIIICIILSSILVLLIAFAAIAINSLRKPVVRDDATRSLLRPNENVDVPQNYYPAQFPFHFAQTQNAPQIFVPGVYFRN